MAFDATLPYEVVEEPKQAVARGFDAALPYEVVEEPKQVATYDPEGKPPIVLAGVDAVNRADGTDGTDRTDRTDGADNADVKLHGADAAATTPKPMPKPPVTTPEAVDGSDVAFEEDGPAFSFTGKVEHDAEGRMVSRSGQIVFDTRSPERFKQGVAEARAAGLLDEEQFKGIDARADDLMRLAKERKGFEERAQKDARWKAALHGLGVGAAVTAGAAFMAPAGAGLGSLAGPGPGTVIGGVAGGLIGGVGGALLYDNAMTQLARHYEEYDDVLRATKLAPAWDAGGQLAFAAAAAPVSLVQGARGLATVADAARRTGQAVAPAVLGQAAVAAGAGAATGAAGYAADSMVHGREMTPGGFAAAAGGGALMSGFFINNRVATTKDVIAAMMKQSAGKKLTAAESVMMDAVGPVARAEYARIYAGGGVPDAGGMPTVRVPMTSVAGFRPAAGKATVEIPHTMPEVRAGLPWSGKVGGVSPESPGPVVIERLPAPVPGAEPPVNVLPRGETPIILGNGGTVAPVAGVPDAVVVPQGGMVTGALMDRVPPVRTVPLDDVPVVTGLSPKLFPRSYLLVDKLELSPDVPNFKEDADPKTGVVKGNELQGTFDDLASGDIVVWERLDGSLQVITGRHRFDLAKRSGAKVISSQVVKEADGFTLQNALTLDAETNIKDGQGTVRDYANYFRHTEIDEGTAISRSLLSRAPQRAGFAIGKGAGDALYTAYRNRAISEAKAAAIAEAAPLDDALQRVALARQRNMSPEELRGFVRAAAAAKVSAPLEVVQGDFFADDSAMLRIEEMAKAANARAVELREQITAVRSAAKRPEAAAKLGVDVRDPEGIMRKVAELEKQAQAWREFYKHPALMAELGGGVEAGGEPVVVAAEGSGGVQPVGNADKLPTVDSHGGGLFSEEEMPFNLAGEVDTVTPTVAELAEAERVAKAQEDFERGQSDLFGGVDSAADKKYGALDAILKEDSSPYQLAERPSNEYQLALKSNSPESSGTALESSTGGGDGAVGGARAENSGRSRVSILGLAVQFVGTKGTGALLGAKVATAQDVAVLSQVYRDPRFETLRTYYVRDGVIVHETAVTSRHAGTTAFLHGKGEQSVSRYLDDVKEQMKAVGADRFYLVHNHPSGVPEPSNGDIIITREIYLAVGDRLSGHIIINSGMYGVLQKTIDGGYERTIHHLPNHDRDEILGVDAVPHQILGGNVYGAEDVARLAKIVEQDPKAYTVITTDNRLRVRGVLHVDLDMLFESPRRFAALMSRLLRTTASRRLYIANVSDEVFNSIYKDTNRSPLLDTAIREGFITDVVSVSGRSWFGESGLRLSELQAGRGWWTGRQVMEDSDVAYSGGGAVPGAGPRAAASGKVPDWVKGKAETRGGRALVWRLENYGPGRRNVGFGSIVDHVNKAVNVDMRRSTSQTSGKHPAHYNVVNRVVFTREGQSQINFHEAGHKLEAMIEGQDAGWFAAHGAELLAIAGRAGSMASSPPNWMSKPEKDRYRMGEGLAEWLRLAVTNPAAVEASPIMGAAEAVVGKYWPKTMGSIRDAARAYERIGRMSAADRWMMFAAGGKEAPATWQDYVGAMARGRDAAARLVSQNAPARGVANRIMRMIRKHHEQMGVTQAEATNIMRDVRAAHLNPMLQAFASERIARPEAMRALDSSGEARGMRVFGADGNYKVFTRDTWKARRERIPAGALHEYDAAAWAQETLTRWESDKMPYPGMRDGITPEVLREIVRDAEVSLKAQGVDFQKQFKLEEDYFHTLLKVKEYGGILAPGEADRISAARPTYRPLPKVYRSGRSGGGSGGLDVQKGVKSAHGSVDAYRSVDEVAVERTFETFESFYKVRARNAMYDRMRAIATDARLPMEVRDLAGRQLVALKLPKELTATVSGDEIKKHVVAAINAQLKDVLGFGNFTEAQLNIDIPGLQVWRKGKPGDVNVMSSFRKGKLVFMQVGDPEVLAMFADDKSVSKVVKFWDWLATPMAQNFQRLITRNLVFGAVRNPTRDVISQLVLNPEKNAGIPLSSHWRGAVNKFIVKYPAVAQDGLLLSRMERGENDALNRLRHGKFAQWLLEGLYIHRDGTPAERVLGTVLNPANWLYPFFKIGDAVNAVTLGSTVAPYTEEIGREGAAVGVKMRGGTDEEAALRYWMAAGQFNEHSGSATLRAIMRPAVFMNPGLQGTRNAVNVLTDPDPAVRGRAWYNLLIKIPAIAAGAAGAAYLFMDGKDKEAERNRPLSDRMGHMNLGGFRVPFSFGPEGVLQSVVYNAMMDYVLDRPATQRDKAAWQLMQQAFDVGGPMQFFGPQLSSWQEAQMNFSTFRQQPIVSPWLQNLPASEQTYATTPEFYNKLGRWADYSPAKLQYLVQQGIGRQLDDTIKLVDAIRGERPIKEWADVPFVGRAFVRDPVGFGSQPMIEFQEIDGKLAALDARLRAAGWAGLKDPKFPIGDVKDENILALRNQLVYLEKLRTGAKLLGVQASFAKAAGMAGNTDVEHNMQRAMTLTATRVLAGDDEMVERIEAAMKMIENLPELSPQQKAAEYLERKY